MVFKPNRKMIFVPTVFVEEVDKKRNCLMRRMTRTDALEILALKLKNDALGDLMIRRGRKRIKDR